MVSALLAVLTAVARPATPPAVDNPPIRVSLNSDAYYQRGDRARVRIRAERDGYVIVLRADVDGRVRVLFPLDPSDDDFVRGGKEYTLPGRGDRETFLVDDRTGDGVILAAFSLEPFHYDEFVRGDHWDYRVLTSDAVRDDPEAGLLDLVTAMADSAHFDYDVLGYTVADHLAYRGYYGGAPCFGCSYGYGSGFGVRIGLGFGAPYYRYGLAYCDPWTDPFFCDPFFYDPFYYPFYYRNAFYYRPYGYCYADPFCFGFGRGGFAYGPRRSYGGFVFKRPIPPPPLVLPRQRAPLTTATIAPRSRVNGSSPDWGATHATPSPRRSAEPGRRSPPPAGQPSRPRSAEPRRRSPPPAARPARPRSAEPRAAKPRARSRQESNRLPVDVSPGRNRRLDGGRSWTERLPVDVSPGRTRRLGVGRGDAARGWMTSRPGLERFGPNARAWQTPRSGGIRFSVPSFRAPSFRGSVGESRRSAGAARAAPRRH
jgi:hypothetical protein